MRETIAQLADSNELKATNLGINELGDGALVLFRTRAEALQASQFCTVPHSLRLSGKGATLPPWLAICFGDFRKSHMSKQEFTERWLAKVETTCPPAYGPAEAWERLVRLGGSRDGSLDMRRLRARLGRQSPPVELANMEFGLPGPVIGTIHASKGREADRVLLLVPREPEFESPEQENEETRVLFVGSTRARQELQIGDAQKAGTSIVGNRRAYRVKGYKNPAAMVEIGKPEDLFVAGLVGTSSASLQECTDAQEWLTTHSSALVSMKVQTDRDRNWNYKVIAQNSEQFVALLSDNFKNDIWKIANRMAESSGKKIHAPYSINHVRTFGSRSIVLSTDDPVLETLHSPWKESGFVLAPRLAAFTKVFFRSANV